MVAVKGKSSTLLTRIDDGGTRKSVGLKNFKVYAENEEEKVHTRSSVNSQRKVSLRAPPCISEAASSTSAMAPGNRLRKSRSLCKGISQTKRDPRTLEKSKGNGDVSIGTNIRKVLADVSNLRANLSRTKVHDGSKPIASKDSSTRNTSSSSSNCAKGKVGENNRQAGVGHHTLKRDTKALKVYVDDVRKKSQIPGSSNAKNGLSARNPLPPTRKSLPVPKRTSQINTSGEKGTADTVEKGSGSSGFHVKPKVIRKVIPQASNSRSHLWKNRVSDGFMTMASKNQPQVDAPSFSRRSVKPVAETANRVSSKMVLKYNRTSGVNKSTDVVAVACKRKDEVVSHTSEDSVSIAPCGSRDQSEVPSHQNSNVGTNISDSIVRRKSDRRKSFTSSLIARSKLLEEQGGVLKLVNFPSIYDESNPLEVAEYVDEIYQYYWSAEAQNQSLVNYMEIQTEVTPQMRGILINWLIEVHLKFDLMQETLYLTVTLLDRYLSLVAIKRNEMQLVGLTALLLASKYEDFWHPRVLDLISVSAETYTRDQMLKMEKAFLKKLKFRLNAPTPYVFMLRFLKAAQADKKLEHLAFYLIELCLVEYEALKFKPSLLCASAVYVARCTLRRTPAWSPLLQTHTLYEETQIRDCAEMILKFHKAARSAALKVSYDKFSRPDQSGVATTTSPLNRLPPLT